MLQSSSLMFTGLKTDSLTISRLFNAPYAFAIPPYQRSYSWTTKEVGQLLDDITSAAGVEDAQAASPDYFLGTVLLLDPSCDASQPGASDSTSRLDVVDGQQRLVTISLIISVLAKLVEDRELGARLRSMLSSGNPDSLPRIAVCEGEAAFYRTAVIDGGELECDDDGEFERDEAPSPLRLAYEYVGQEISALTPADQIVLSRYLLDFCHVVIIITRDIDRAHLLFTVLNDRGRPLQRKDILKVEVLSCVKQDREDVALARWDAASAKLGNDFESLFSHIRTIHCSGRPQIISAMRALVRQHGCEAFLGQILSPMADAFQLVRRFPEVEKRALEHPEIAAALTSLNRFGNSDWIAPAMIAMSRFEADPVGTARIVSEIDRMSFLLKVLAFGGAKRQRRTAQIIQALTRGLDHEIDAAFSITREESRALLHHLKDIHRRNPALAKLILMRIEDEIRGTPLLLSTTELSIEHILPQRPSPTSEWRRVFASGEQREVCLNSLGNLALVPPRVNEKLKNKEFAEKHAIISSVQARSELMLRTNEDILDASEWTAEHILAREARLLAILGRLWRIDGVSSGPERPGSCDRAVPVET